MRIHKSDFNDLDHIIRTKVCQYFIEVSSIKAINYFDEEFNKLKCDLLFENGETLVFKIRCTFKGVDKTASSNYKLSLEFTQTSIKELFEVINYLICLKDGLKANASDLIGCFMKSNMRPGKYYTLIN